MKRSRLVDLATPPKHLSDEAKALWQRLTDDYDLDDAGGLALLRVAAEAFDRAQAARRVVDSEGMFVTGRFGTKEAHPGLKVEAEARRQLVSALRAMRLAPADVGLSP